MNRHIEGDTIRPYVTLDGTARSKYYNQRTTGVRLGVDCSNAYVATQ